MYLTSLNYKNSLGAKFDFCENMRRHTVAVGFDIFSIFDFAPGTFYGIAPHLHLADELTQLVEYIPSCSSSVVSIMEQVLFSCLPCPFSSVVYTDIVVAVLKIFSTKSLSMG